MCSWACAISTMICAWTAQHQESSAFGGISYEGLLDDWLMIEVSVAQCRARIISIGFVVSCFR